MGYFTYYGENCELKGKKYGATFQLCEIDFKTKLNFHEWLVWFFVVFDAVVAAFAVVAVVVVDVVVVVTVVDVTAVVVVVDVDVCVPFRQPGPKKMSELDNESRRRTQFLPTTGFPLKIFDSGGCSSPATIAINLTSSQTQICEGYFFGKPDLFSYFYLIIMKLDFA